MRLPLVEFPAKGLRTGGRSEDTFTLEDEAERQAVRRGRDRVTAAENLVQDEGAGRAGGEDIELHSRVEVQTIL